MIKGAKLVNFLIIIFLLVAKSAQAAGISVKPSELHFTLQAKSQASQTVVIENISDQPVIYNLYVDEMGEQIFLEPNNFRLEIGEKKRIKVKVQPEKSGTFITNLSIVAQDLDRRKFNLSTGVKIPLSLAVSPFLSNWPKKVIIILSPALIIMVLASALLVRRKKKKWYQRLGDAAVNLLHHQKPWWKIW